MGEMMCRLQFKARQPLWEVQLQLRQQKQQQETKWSNDDSPDPKRTDQTGMRSDQFGFCVRVSAGESSERRAGAEVQVQENRADTRLDWTGQKESIAGVRGANGLGGTYQ